MWFHLDWTLPEIHKNVITQFIYLANSNDDDDKDKDPLALYQETYADMLSLLKEGKEVESNFLE